ncbi:M23 family metallopeptidase [Cryobacterium zhongshanensis]|uniref:M23 family metallopeptidase n=1 Tax=Cryobacterium zhongshanensis TaxID=2928153 RepID=A0AA41QVA4_9MICO|nr:M23 family metallopeptidase [Cryobacterium zhongshanensis]MCI4658465.1 M23 family metallopeptidase [Cryobacterium zhongshanensis]
MSSTEYPSWSDVEAARSDETAKQAQTDKITALIQQLDSEAATLRDTATRRATEYDKAQLALDDAAVTASTISAQADAAKAEADDSREKVGRLASTMAKSGSPGVGMTMQVFLAGDETDELLSQLGSMSKLSETIDGLYSKALTDTNTAASLSDQAKVALTAREELAGKAQQALTEAAAASAAAETKLVEQQQFADTLRAQLAVLEENRAATEADFQTGEEARRAAEAAAAAAAAATAAATASAGPNLDSGQLSDQGWTRPVPGRVTDSFGPRPQQPVAGVNPFHYATDLSAGCSVPIYAASSGRVAYAGSMGSYGNWLLLEHGSGVQTGYAHTSRLLVSNGDSVQAGQVVALVGTTGASTGCHLHFEVRVDGARINPQSFMSARGAPLG